MKKVILVLFLLAVVMLFFGCAKKPVLDVNGTNINDVVGSGRVDNLNGDIFCEKQYPSYYFSKANLLSNIDSSTKIVSRSSKETVSEIKIFGDIVLPEQLYGPHQYNEWIFVDKINKTAKRYHIDIIGPNVGICFLEENVTYLDYKDKVLASELAGEIKTFNGKECFLLKEKWKYSDNQIGFDWGDCVDKSSCGLVEYGAIKYGIEVNAEITEFNSNIIDDSLFALPSACDNPTFNEAGNGTDNDFGFVNPDFKITDIGIDESALNQDPEAFDACISSCLNQLESDFSFDADGCSEECINQYT